MFVVGPSATMTSPRPELASLAASGEYQCEAIATVKVELRGAGFAHLIPGRDAHRIYLQAHRAETCVLTGKDVVIALDPSDGPPYARRAVRSVYGFLKYKACVLPSGVPGWQAPFAAWRADPGRLDDHRDPRCLPFQVFDCGDEVPDLTTPELRAAFDRLCGSKLGREDVRSRVWETDPTAFHGRPPPLRVAGHALPVGMHWDVQGRGKGVTMVANSIEIWRVPREDYLNVAPNAYLSASSGRSQARRIFPRPGAKA